MVHPEAAPRSEVAAVAEVEEDTLPTVVVLAVHLEAEVGSEG